MVTHAFNHCTQEAEAGGFVKLPWPTTVSSRTARAMERRPVSKKTKKNNYPQSLGEWQDWTRLAQCLLTSMPSLQGVCIHFLSPPLPCLHVCYSLQPKCSRYCNPISLPLLGRVCVADLGLQYVCSPSGFYGGLETEAVDNPQYHLQVWNCTLSLFFFYKKKEKKKKVYILGL